MLLKPPFSLRRACVEFDSEHVVDEVDLTIGLGEFVAILGENGTGKTTLMRALLGLVPLAHGSLRLFGEPADEFRDWQRLAYVPQRLLAAGNVPVSVNEVVRSARISPRHRFRPDRGAATRVRDALEQVGLTHRAHDRFDSLSGGQQRRAMIARALTTDADAFVLDEPTAGIDAESQEHLAATLATLSASGRTILLVTHELGAVAGLATRAIVLGRTDHGSVLYDGPAPPPRHLRHDIAHHEHDHLTVSDDGASILDLPPEAP
jgi:zinc transport system ATP-binding protein